MEMYHELYLQLFNAMSEALRELEEQNVGRAREVLLSAQLQAEGRVIKG